MNVIQVMYCLQDFLLTMIMLITVILLEISKGHRNIIEQTSANSLTIWDPLSFDVKAQGQRGPKDANCWARNFSYDHVLWSDNESSTSDAQERVHETIGTSIVDWAVDGYNTCVLAYGQTGLTY